MLTNLEVHGEHSFYEDLANSFDELSDQLYHQVDTQLEAVLEIIVDPITWVISSQLFVDLRK